MSQPTPYTPTTDFSQQEANNASGRSTVNTAALDAEFAAIDTTLDQTLANIQLLQRDDGRLMDVSVEMHTLSPEVLNLMGGFNLRGAWILNTDYAVNDLVSNGSYTYVCVTAHNSGPTFSETNWLKFGFAGSNDAAQAAAAAAVSANEAHISELAAAASAVTASGFATTATTQAGLASSSATAADASADAAAISETNAANSASDAASSAASISIPGGKTMVLKDSAGVSYVEGAAGTTAQRPGSPVVGYERFNSDTGKDETWNGSAWVSAIYDSDTGTTANKVVKLNGSAQLPAIDGSLLTGVVPTIADSSITPVKLTQPLTLGTAQATTSGTSIDFTGIPSWVKRIAVMIAGVSQSGTDAFLVQLGDSGGVESTGYTTATSYSVGANTTSTYSSGAGFPIHNTGTGLAWHGSITLTLLNAATNTWVASGVTNRSDVSLICDTSGSKSLSGVLDRVRLTTVSGTGTFTAGSVNIMYE